MRGTTTRTPERVAVAQRLRAEGKMWREIAEALGVAVSTAQEWGTDTDGSKRSARKARYDLVCVDCGGRVDGTTPSKMSNPDEPVCGHCAAEHYAVWTRNAIVEALQRWAAEHGRTPSAPEFQRAKVEFGSEIPTVNHVIGRFGTWTNAIRAAGLKPNGGGPRAGLYHRLTDEQREECVRRYVAGESSVRIAADFGCSPTWVMKLVHRANAEVRPIFGRAA